MLIWFGRSEQISRYIGLFKLLLANLFWVIPVGSRLMSQLGPNTDHKHNIFIPVFFMQYITCCACQTRAILSPVLKIIETSFASFLVCQNPGWLEACSSAATLLPRDTSDLHSSCYSIGPCFDTGVCCSPTQLSDTRYYRIEISTTNRMCIRNFHVNP